MAYHPGDEQECRMSSHAQAKGTTRAVAVARASTACDAPACGARVRAGPGLASRLLVVTGKPVCEPLTTGEPGALCCDLGGRSLRTLPSQLEIGAVSSSHNGAKAYRVTRAEDSNSPRPVWCVAEGPKPVNAFADISRSTSA